MKNKFGRAVVSVAVVGLGLVGTASATLIDRGNGMIYDSAQDITWLQDANYAKTSGYDTDGLMNWQEAKNWAENLSYGGYDDWRLWSALDADGDTCSGTSCTGSELGHLFYVDGGLTAKSAITSSTTLMGIFQNLQNRYYWSGTHEEGDFAWLFWTSVGEQALGYDFYSHYAWAVRSGDVATTPLPAAGWLFGGALAGLAVGAGRRRRTG